MSTTRVRAVLWRATAVLLINEIDVYESSDPWGFAARQIGGVQVRKQR